MRLGGGHGPRDRVADVDRDILSEEGAATGSGNKLAAATSTAARKTAQTCPHPHEQRAR